MDNQKYEALRRTLDNMLTVARVGIAEGEKLAETHNNAEFYIKLKAKYEGREAVLMDIIQMLEDEDFFWQMVDNYNLKY